MQIDIQQKLINDKQMNEYLKLNSHWYKKLNRNPDNYKKFTEHMKEQYKIRATDKINDAMDNIDIVTSVLNALK